MIEAERQGYSVDKKFVSETADRTLGSREKMIASRILPDPKGKPDTRPGSNMGIVFVAIAGRALPSLSEGQKQSLQLIAAEIPKKQEKSGWWKSVDDRIVEGGSKWRRGAAEFGGAGLVKVSLGQLGVAVVV